MNAGDMLPSSSSGRSRVNVAAQACETCRRRYSPATLRIAVSFDILRRCATGRVDATNYGPNVGRPCRVRGRNTTCADPCRAGSLCQRLNVECRYRDSSPGPRYELHLDVIRSEASHSC